MTSNHKDINTYDNVQAAAILKLVKEHRLTCDGKCGITLFLLFPIYRKLVGEGAIKDLENFI